MLLSLFSRKFVHTLDFSKDRAIIKSEEDAYGSKTAKKSQNKGGRKGGRKGGEKDCEKNGEKDDEKDGEKTDF